MQQEYSKEAEQRTIQLTYRVSPQEYNSIKIACKIKALSFPAFSRMLAVTTAREICQEHKLQKEQLQEVQQAAA